MQEQQIRQSIVLGRPTGRTAVAAGCDKGQAVHGCQSTRCWSVAQSQGDSAQPNSAASALLGDRNVWPSYLVAAAVLFRIRGSESLSGCLGSRALISARMTI